MLSGKVQKLVNTQALGVRDDKRMAPTLSDVAAAMANTTNPSKFSSLLGLNLASDQHLSRY